MKSIFVFPVSLFLWLTGCVSHDESLPHIKSNAVKPPSFSEDISQTPIYGWSPVPSNTPYSSYFDSKTIHTQRQEKTVHVVTIFNTANPFIVQSLHRFDCSKENKLTALQLSMQPEQQKTLGGFEQSLMEAMKSESLNWSMGKSVCQHPDKLMVLAFPKTNTFVFADVLKKSAQHSYPTKSM